MAILNYTTTVDSFKTVSEIEYILMKHKAKSIMKNYAGESIIGLSFLIDTGVQQVPVRLPVRVDECLEVLKQEKQSITVLRKPKSALKESIQGYHSGNGCVSARGIKPRHLPQNTI